MEYATQVSNMLEDDLAVFFFTLVDVSVFIPDAQFVSGIWNSATEKKTNNTSNTGFFFSILHFQEKSWQSIFEM